MGLVSGQSVKRGRHHSSEENQASQLSQGMESKRPRDEAVEETESSSSSGTSSSSSSSCLTTTTATSSSSGSGDTDSVDSLSFPKIRTSSPPLTKQKKMKRGPPRVLAGRPRTAYPLMRLSSPSKKSSSSSSNASSKSDYIDIDCEEVNEETEVDCSSATLDSEEEVDDQDQDLPLEEGKGGKEAQGVEEPPEIVPAIRPSYFPNVPPYINFCLHSQKTEELPKEIGKHMKWRLSNITPVVVKRTLTASGFKLRRKTVEWCGQWGRHMKAAEFKTSLKDFQKLNHLPGTFQIGRKDRLWRNVQRFQIKFGKEFSFMPTTYVLPLEKKQLKAVFEKEKMWIVKPPALARGTGIRVINKFSQIPKKKGVIVQSYIANPYLINERKFDLRLYVLVTSFHPLKIYLYNDGLVRFAPVKYSHDSKRCSDRFMHLTNYSINKNCQLYTANEDAEEAAGHKWTLKTLWRHMVQEGKDVQKVWTEIEEIVIKTLISAEDPIVTATTCFMPNLYNGYELFGFDIILDDNLKPWLLEVNISPSLHSSSPLDLAVKGPMIKEVFNIAGFQIPPKISPNLKNMFTNSLDQYLELETPVFDRRIFAHNSLSKEESAKHKQFRSTFEKRDHYLDSIIELLTPDDVRQLIVAEDELSQCRSFCRIFPTTTTHTYAPYFELPRYYNQLLDAWENTYHDDRIAGVNRLRELCRQKVHLQVTSVSGVISEIQPAIPSSNGTVAVITAASSTGALESESTLASSSFSSELESLLKGGSGDIVPEKKMEEVKTDYVPVAVLDNITNNCCARSPCPCHSSPAGEAAKATASPPSTLPKGLCC